MSGRVPEDESSALRWRLVVAYVLAVVILVIGATSFVTPILIGCVILAGSIVYFGHRLWGRG